MKSTFLRFNLSVFDLKESLAFYGKALDLTEKRHKTAANGSPILTYLTDNSTDFELELTWIRDRKEPYNLGDNEIHLAVHAPDKQEAYKLHKNMGCICYENHEMNLYLVDDPDGCQIGILDR